MINYCFQLGGESSNELDSISDISLSGHELQLKEIVITSDFNNNHYEDGEFDNEDYSENYDLSNKDYDNNEQIDLDL